MIGIPISHCRILAQLAGAMRAVDEAKDLRHGRHVLLN